MDLRSIPDGLRRGLRLRQHRGPGASGLARPRPDRGGAALFATIGILPALRHRDLTGRGRYVDVAIFDSVVAMTDIVTNFWSMEGELGLATNELGALRADGVIT
jgi:hypothetical protein